MNDKELEDPASWDWERAELRPGRKPQPGSTTSSTTVLKYARTEASVGSLVTYTTEH